MGVVKAGNSRRDFKGGYPEYRGQGGRKRNEWATRVENEGSDIDREKPCRTQKGKIF